MRNCCKLTSTGGCGTVPKHHVVNKLASHFAPGPLDVICGKGKAVQNHAGNKRYQTIIHSYLERYARTTLKLQKIAIVSEIVALIRLSSPGGGFVKLIAGAWYEVGDHFSREKVSQSLRDCLYPLYSSSSRAKSVVRRRHRADNKKYPSSS